MQVLQQEFRAARRTTGLVYDRLPNDKEFSLLLHHPKYGWTITSPALELLDFVEEQGWQDFQMVESLNLLDVLGTLPKGGNSSAGAETRTKKPSSTRKYICPKCGNSCRATKVINIICGDCMEKMVVAE